MDDGKRAELLLGHYQDTFRHTLYHWKARNWLFVAILILMAALAVDIFEPGLLTKLADAYVRGVLETARLEGDGSESKQIIDVPIVDSLLWLLLLSLVIQYFQRSIHVDRQYRYLHHTEEHLCRLMQGDYITREGKAYLSRTGDPSDSDRRRPLYLMAVGPLYVYLFPTLLMTLVALRLWVSWTTHAWPVCVFHSLIGALVALYSGLYLRWVISNR